MNKKASLFIPAFISVALTILLVLVFTNEMKKKKTEISNNKVEYLLKIEKDNECKGIEDYTNEIKTYCIKEIYYNDGDKSLRSVLNEKITVDEIINKLSILEHTDSYSLFEDTSDVGSIYFRILKCNNKYIIGTRELAYKKELCE